MRIVVISPNLPTRALPMRGASHDEQLLRFAAAGHEVRAIVPLAWSLRRRLTGTSVPNEERDGGVVVSHPRYPRLPRALRNGALERSLFARAAAAALGPDGMSAPADVVLAHSALLPGGLAGRVGGAAFVVSLYDHEVYDLAPASVAMRELIIGTLRRAHRAVYLSEALRRHATELAGPHRSMVIPLGIETYPGLHPRPPERFTICTVTRLIARKRVDRLIGVFARLAQERPNVRLVIVGDGPERANLERLVRALDIEPLVELTGALDARTARERMARSSVMALPSVRESLGAVYLEAMSLGIPALGTRGEGIEEHIRHGDNGLLVPPDDDEALLAELRALAADPERARRIGEAGRRYFRAGPFSWETNVESYLALFAEVSNSRGGRG